MKWFNLSIKKPHTPKSVLLFSKGMFENLNMIFPIDTLMQNLGKMPALNRRKTKAINFGTVLYNYYIIRGTIQK